MEKTNYGLLREYVSLLLEEGRREPLNVYVPPVVEKIHELMQGRGKKLYIVGGAVRDALLGKKPKDYDLATDATPDQIVHILEGRLGSRAFGYDFKIDLTGKSFGVIRIKTPDGEEYEIATFRKDIGKGRRPDAVEFTDIETDVNRRDLTMNALFYDLSSGEVVDYVGGIDDIRNGVAKAVGDPALRFEEDKLRMLRTARFAGRTGFDIDPETAEAIRDDPGLRIGDGKVVGEERVTEEFKKGVSSATDPREYLATLRDLGLLSQIFPGLSIDPNTESSSDNSTIQVALLLKNNDPAQVRSTLGSMRYSNEEKNIVDFLLRFQDISPESAPRLKDLFKRYKISDVYLYDFSDATGIPPRQNIRAFIEFVGMPKAGDPREFMAQGLRGPDIGRAMATAESDAYAKLTKESADLLLTVYGNLLNEKF